MNNFPDTWHRRDDSYCRELSRRPTLIYVENALRPIVFLLSSPLSFPGDSKGDRKEFPTEDTRRKP
jgi:hypothetical protein